MRTHFTRTFLLGLFLLFTSASANAASLYIDPAKSSLNRGDAIELSVRLDVDEQTGECVNAIDAVISYSDNIAPVDISIGDSIFTMWVERPTINRENRTITFAGGMPNGYCGRVSGDPRLTNRIVKLIFRSPGFTIGTNSSNGDEAVVSFTDLTNVYLNDGLGTRVVPDTYDATIALSTAAGSGIVDPWREAVEQDEIPPEEFSVFLERDTKAFRGKYYISFNTTDKQTGIDQYQIIEEPLEAFGSFDWGRGDAPWITIRSPYVLEDQTLNSTIRVRAIDKAGNEYIATLVPDESLRTMSKGKVTSFAVYGLIGLIVLGCLGVIFAFFLIRFKAKKRDEEESAENASEAEEKELDDDEAKEE